MLGPWWGQGEDEDAVTRRRRHQGPEPGHDLPPRAARSMDKGRRSTTRPTSAGPTPASPRRSPPPTAPTRWCWRSARRRGQSGEAGRAVRDRPARQAAGAARRDQGHRQAVRGRAVQRPPADAGQRGRGRAGDPRGLVPGHRGRQRRSPTSLFGKVNPGGKLPVSFPRRSARCRSTTTTSPPAGRATPREVQLALPRPALVRAAVRVRLRPQLHDVQRLQPAAQSRVDVAQRDACRPRST